MATANQLAQEHFGGRQPPEGRTWLEVLVQTNLFRRDPPPHSDVVEKFNPPSELIRFSFQRFQDFLMADSLVDKVVAMNVTRSEYKIPKLMQRVLSYLRKLYSGGKQNRGTEFYRSGPLNFIFYENDPHGNIRYECAGLLGALSTLYPEKLGVEFANSLPDRETLWGHGGPLHGAFGESFKWRQLNCFNDETRELLYKLDADLIDPQSLMLEVSMTIKHPYNAEHLHERLRES